MHYPRSRARWERLLWWRGPRCGACGVPWMCDEAMKERLRSQSPRVRNDRTGAWATEAAVDHPEESGPEAFGPTAVQLANSGIRPGLDNGQRARRLGGDGSND